MATCAASASPMRERRAADLAACSIPDRGEALGRSSAASPAEFARVDAAETRVSTLPVAVPYATRLLPAASFDLRQALLIHARGIAGVMRNEAQRSPKSKAFTMSAELFLMQHTCHWYCKSKTVASARMLTRHQTSYEQLLAAVSPETRSAYSALTGQ